jgi:amino acid adenylation domain-containing protein
MNKSYPTMAVSDRPVEPTGDCVQVPPGPSFMEWPAEEIARSVLSRFDAMVAQFADRVALASGDQALSYDGLNQRANRLARALLARVGEGTHPIALLLEHDLDVVVAILAVLKAGKFYVALDPAYPAARLEAILSDSGARLVITNTRNLSIAAGLFPATAPLLNLDELDAGFPTAGLNLSIDPDHPLNLTYTSGSTRRPKGVLQTHRNILHNTREATHLLKFSSIDRFALIMPVTFGASAADIFGALLNGAALFPFDLKRQGVGMLGHWLNEMKISVYHSVPTVYRHMLGLLKGTLFPHLRIIQLGGEPVMARDIGLFKMHFADHCILMNDLGTTETYLATAYLADKTTNIDGSIVPIGFPLNGRQALLLDEKLQPVPLGQVGQIAIKSRYLSPGYWGQPELTAAVFLPDPAGGPERLYLTGDLGRMRPDGCLVHLGRKDEMVKIRGHRVEIAEVEMALLDLEAVREAVVVPQEDPRGERCLVAYVVPRSGYDVPALDRESAGGDLRKALAEKLPAFTVPAAFVMMDQLPLLPFGKVNRRALPAPDWDGSGRETTYAPPRDELEHQVAAIWEKVLGVRPIGVNDNFFALGGHSLLAGHLFAQIEAGMGKRLPLEALFHAPTVAQLSEALRQEGWSPPWHSLVALQPDGSRPPLFCVPGVLGNVYADLSDLARFLGPDQPLYGLQDNLGNPAQIEALAGMYLAEIRTAQPKGPYLLAGVCSGGIVAFEMAQRLRAAGQPVALLAMVETPYLRATGPRSYARFATFMLRRLFKRLGRHSRNLTASGAVGRRDYLRLKLKLVANEWALKQYAPLPYPGQVDLFISDESLGTPQNRFSRWRAMADEAEVHSLPGGHDSIVGDNSPIDPAQIAALADGLRACIDAALSDSGSA